MLRIVYGRAGTGRTQRLLRRIRRAVDAREPGQIILVPDQYSHDCERALCAVCGDTASLYAEVLSLTRLASRVFAREGGLARQHLEEGGRLLAMDLALDLVETQLTFYRSRGERPGFLRDLVAAYDEACCCMVTPEALRSAAEQADPFTQAKFLDLALVFESYEAVIAQLKEDPRQTVTALTQTLELGGFAGEHRFYIDGFGGFTPQEQELLQVLVRRAPLVELYLACDTLEEEGEECFGRSRRLARRLLRYAQRHGVPCETERLLDHVEEKDPALTHLERALFDHAAPAYEGTADAVALFPADTMLGECELAAAEVLRLVREKGLRYREIAVTGRDFSDYESLLRGVFQRYGIPLYEDETSDLLEKPVLTLVLSALWAVENRYTYEAMFRYLKTGLAGLEADQTDRLENYCLIWNIRGDRWKRQWNMDPRGMGFGADVPESVRRELEALNGWRRQVIEPLEAFRKATEGEPSARTHAAELFRLLERLAVPQSIARRETALRDSGALQQAEEYRQLWEILMQALDQCVAVLDQRPMTRERFAGLFRLLLGQYRVGSIPVAMDRVSAGDVQRLRLRSVRALLVLGATDDRLPKLSREGGLFSEDDREFLADQGLELGVWGTRRIEREMDLIYTLVTLPTQRLCVFWPRYRDGETRPSFLTDRIKQVFPGVSERSQRDFAGEQYLCAPKPCFALAASQGHGNAHEERNRRLARLALAEDEALTRLLAQKPVPRGPLSETAVRRLFGSRIRMSASRMDRYRSCRFAYLMQYGLKLRPRRQARFDAPAIGTFLHYLLEHTVRRVMELGGPDQVSEAQLKELTDTLTERYIAEELGGLEDKTARFRHLFSRLCDTVLRMVESVLEELQQGDFRPLDYELDFSQHGDLPPVTVSVGDSVMELGGVVDRVDGFVCRDKLYIRVMDYKSGVKAFDLTDIWYGLSTQMLLYLFALEEHARGRYGREVVPAGVLYVPIRNPVLRERRDCFDAELKRKYQDLLRRSGLLLNDREVICAMERGIQGKAQFLPVGVTRDQKFDASSSLATAEQFGKLRRHVNRLLRQLAAELSSGRTEADPYVRGPQSACDYCDFAMVCHFDESAGEDQKRILKHMDAKAFWEQAGGGDDGI